ncbi:T9SS type A sorting domain-containing protein [Hymenobacter properus]|uniref:T9SS type A sorting domain-containing protein n=1 Tax=Hymenobacter properus TaxID=2791026 RepID=A0A931BFL8_9BACT|nr:T9SS type A sorting domain-containing protein [Hymenobacter properus]MBF9142564.1 T9SS type A sorting domain-containing protein [Hymenobacter properus]MBR7721371.1 T9SS type A sorting domain-containing protein [Microvirga sp. SRT04]
MFRSYAFLLALLAFSFATRAQSRFGFEYRAAAKVVEGTDTLSNAWAGGLNTPQFSHIDLDNDGRADLFAFDHESSRVYTFLNVAAPGTTAGRRWQYAPQYESIFPDSLRNWVLLRDYDCDGRPDIFTYTSGGNIAVLRNVLANGRPSFQRAFSQLRFSGNFSGTANLNIGAYNLPAIQDVNGDGKLDIMSYDFVASVVIEQYINTSPGTCGSALTFARTATQWGDLRACGACAEFGIGTAPCFTAAKTTHTGGHNLLLVDLDGDGDQDLLDGRDNCPELTRLLNQGTTAAPLLTQAGISASFPSAATPARVPVFPAGYLLDANFDGTPDLVVAPNMLTNQADQVSMRNNVQLFTNAAATGAPAYTNQAAGFLQNTMIDVSEGAAPTLGDIDGDGLPDLLIGNHADRVNNVYRAALAYYRNVGTRARPVFQLVSRDYLGLSAQNLQGLKPMLVDLNRDGALDLAYAAWGLATNQIYYILNTARAGQPASFDPAAVRTFKGQGSGTTTPPTNPSLTDGTLPYRQGDMPFFTDVDNDGYVDLLIGTNEIREPGMALRYFRNRARGPLDSAFVLVNNDFGRIRDANGARPLNLAPAVADFDGDGLPDLVTADASGYLRLFSNFRAQSAALFTERTDLIYNPLKASYEPARLGLDVYAHYGLTAADLNGDGAPELLVGTQAGGLLSFGTINRTTTATRAEAAAALALSIYPNPAIATATVETAQPTRLTVLDLTGRVVQTLGTAQRRHALTLSGLSPGVYLVRAVGNDGATAVQRLAVQ